MAQNKYYYYDHETCTFVETTPPAKTPFKFGMWGIAGAVGLSVLVLIGFYMWGGSSPQEYKLKNENEALRSQLNRTGHRVDEVFERLDKLYQKDSELYRVVFQVDPISEDVRKVGVGGADEYEKFDGYSDETSRLLRRINSAIDKLDRQMNLQGASFKELMTIAQQRKGQYDGKPIMMPVNGGRITSGFGYRIHPIAGVRKMHDGLDVVIPIGTPVYAPASGVVEFAGGKGGYGNAVMVKHDGSGYTTLYAHLSRFNVSVGQKVKRGDIIAYTGNSGSSTGPHLHYEVQNADGSQKFNPMDFIAPSMTPSALKNAIKGAETESASLDF
jgi:murein DD-endopeptidase MepM/ murein hydrolase activator NlpD